MTETGLAGHLITSWAEEGVNLALWDSLDLEDALAGVSEAQFEDATAWQKALEPRILEYEEKVFMMAAERAEDTAKKNDLFSSERDAEETANFF